MCVDISKVYTFISTAPVDIRKNYRHKSIAYINILILETTGSKILLKTLGFKSKWETLGSNFYYFILKYLVKSLITLLW